MIAHLSYHRFCAALILIAVLLPASAFGQDTYDSLYATMQARQMALDSLLMDPSRCLGERLDGFLEINNNCSVEERQLAEDENNDRKRLNSLMANDLGLAPEEVGKQRAERNLERYSAGVLREIRISPTQTTWWDGQPPDPRLVPRLLSLQNARIHAAASESSPVVRDNVQQYEVFSVIEKATDSGGETWFQVTEEYVPKIKPPQWSPNPIGWIQEKNTIPWRWALVMRFTNPLNRDPSLFFNNEETLLNLARLDPAQRTEQVKTLRDRIAGGNVQGTDIIAVEPKVGLQQESAIIYPVLSYYPPEASNKLLIDGMASRLLEVAARTRSSENANVESDIQLDILFVMDTSESMQPHLDGVLKAMEEFTQANENDNVHFGFIAYRDKDPAFGYVTKAYTSSPLSGLDFVSILASVKAQTPVVKGDDYPEAVFEGVDTALESFQWRDNTIKVIFLVGDAPGRDEDDLNVEVLRDKANTRHIKIQTFNLQNTSSQNYQREATSQFGSLSVTYSGAYGASPETQHMYTLDAQAGDLSGTMLQCFIEAGHALESISKVSDSSDSLPVSTSGSLSELIFQEAVLMLADSSVPKNETRGWVCDKVLSNTSREALAPMVLLTQAELEELESRVRELKTIGEEVIRGEGETAVDFFDLVSLNTRFTMVDPTAVNFRDSFSIPLGIDQLPYDSDIMYITREDFRNPDTVKDFVQSMDNKLKHYEDLLRQHGDAMVWKKLSKGARDSDRVVAMELKYLP